MRETNIYIVEDEALIAMEIQDRLTQLGYPICGNATSGEQALEEVPRLCPDLVLMDIRLAGKLTGTETAAKLRPSQNVPIVFLTAFSDDTLISEAVDSGAFGYLIKPFDEQELHATIQAAICKHRMECALREANAVLEKAVRKRTTALMESEAQIRDLIDSTNDLIYSVTPPGHLLFANRAWCQTLGYSKAEVQSLNIFDIIPAEHHDHYRDAIQRIVAGEPGSLLETPLRSKHGLTIVAEGLISLREEHGLPMAIRGIFRNVTAQFAAQQQLQVLNQNLERLIDERTAQWRKSEERYRNLVATIPGAVYEFRIDASGRRSIPFISEGIAELMGLSPDDIMANADIIFRQIRPEALPALEESILRSLENLSPWIHEFPATTPADTTTWLRGHSIPHRKDDGSTHWNGVLVDITARKQAEDALRRSIERFDLAVRGSRDGLWDIFIVAHNPYSIDNPVYYSPRMKEIMGVTDEDQADVLGTWSALVHPDDRERVFAALDAHLTHHTPYDITYRIVKHNGDCRWIASKGQAQWSASGTPLRMAGSFSDITERIKAEQVLQSLTQKLEAMIRTSPLAIISLDEEGKRVLTWNSAAEKIFGWSAEEVLGKPLPIIPDSDTKHARHLWSAITRGEHAHGIELRWQRKDGSLIDIMLWAAVLQDAIGHPVESVAFIVDMTERKQADAALKRFQEQIRQMQKQEALGQLASGIAHDFNNLLTAILGNADLADARLTADHPSKSHLARIIQAGNRASQLVQQILTFTRQQEVTRTAQPLAPIITEAMALLRATLPAGVALTSTVDATTPSVLADATQLHQVIMNLCTNAWHAMKNRPGAITISLAPITLPQPQHSLQTTLPPGLYAHLSISDTGCGMDAETLERIFDPFFTTKPVGQGTGLGLSVVQGIIQGHDGAIVVESQPGQGTTFHLYLPATSIPEQANTPRASAAAPRDGQGRHLLYVDDETMLVELIVARFEPLGYRVTGLTSATGALEAIRAHPQDFDVVVTDYNMPEMSGLEIAQAVANIRADLPVVLVSGYLSPAAQADALSARIKEIVYKPTMLQCLEDVIAKLLNPPPPTT